PSSPAAASNGIRAASRANPSASVGLSPPGSSPSSSSRGEKARPAGGAGRVAPPQPQRGALPRGQDPARVPPPPLQRPAALRAPPPRAPPASPAGAPPATPPAPAPPPPPAPPIPAAAPRSPCQAPAPAAPRAGRQSNPSRKILTGTLRSDPPLCAAPMSEMLSE